MDFKDPWILYLIPFICTFLIILYRRQKRLSLRFPSKKLFTHLPGSWKLTFINTPFYLRLCVISLFLVALAGPRLVNEEIETKTEGIDIILSVDLSGSMEAEDFVLNKQRVNRLAVVKEVVKEFIEKRVSDQIGLVVFAARAFTVCPMTIDSSWLQENVDRLEIGLVNESRTAVGAGINTATSRLENSKAKSRVIILLTDGEDTVRNYDPITAAKVAAELGVKIYTIGVGTNDVVPVPTTDFFGRRVYHYRRFPLDEKTLKEIARLTNGQYYRAANTESLRRIYDEIDQLEKVEIKETGYFSYKQLFNRFLFGGLAFLVLELVLANTLLLRIP